MDTALAGEISRATSSEASIAAKASTALACEASRATASEASVAEKASTALACEASRATESEASLTTALACEASRAVASETAVAEAASTALACEASRATESEASLASSITDINDLIPAEATTDNQLADKAFVNSSIGTNTANYISYVDPVTGEDVGPFPDKATLEAYSGSITNNDYAFVIITEDGNTYFDRYKARVNGSTVTWAFEYRLNNSSFTSTQWAAINSGITDTLVGKITTTETNLANEVTRATEAEASYASQASLALASEVSRATGVESSLNTAISTETSRATASEASLSSDISGEISRAIASEASIAAIAGSGIDNEISRATASEASIASVASKALACEASRAVASEASLATAIGTETSRATASEASIVEAASTALACEASRATASEASVATAVTNENTRAVACEASYASIASKALASEVSRATSAEANLNTAIETEVSRAVACEASYASQASKALASEVSRATSAEADIVESASNALASEVSRATASEASLTTAISDENTRATASEASLTTALACEASRAEASEASIAAIAGSGIETEVSRATASEASLTTAISNETSRATASEASITEKASNALASEVSRATGAEASLTTAIDTETSRATASESSLTTALACEASRAEASEASIAAVASSGIDDEISRATASESSLATAIETETSRATASEASLTTAIGAETSRATASEASLSSDISNEVSRATASEASLTTAISAETSRATASESSLASDISDETSRATASEASIAAIASSGIASEISRATASESSLASDISDEISRAEASESSLATVISNEISRATAAEDEIETSISSEISRATASESSLATAISNENTRAEASESSLASAISTETSRATGAESSLASAISTETSRATGAESSIAEAASNALASEVSRATASEASIAAIASSGIDEEVSRATAAEASLASDITSETSRATGVESELSSAISTEVSRATSAEANLANTKYDTLATTGSGTLVSAIEATGTTLKITKTKAYEHPTYEIDGTTGTSTPGFGGTFSAIASVEVNELGHVTGYQTDTFTIPNTVATTAAAGLMSATMVEKLAGIETGANKYELPAATTAALGGVIVGENLTVTASGVLSANPAVTVETTGAGNAITEISAASGVLTAVFGKTFSESTHTHNNYVSTVTAGTGSGNVVTSVTSSGNTLTYVKGITALTAHPSVNVSADTTSTTSPGSGGTFSAIDSITKDEFGHVTKVDTVTVTMPTIPTELPASNTTDIYSSTGTDPVSGKAVNAALQTLDVSAVGGNDKYITTVSQTDGKISASAATFSDAVKAIKVDVATSACSASSVEWANVQNKIDASANAAGLMNTGAQTFAGDKTFTDAVTIGDATLSYSTVGLDNILTLSFSAIPIIRKPVSGTIFYINDTAAGTYQFYNSNDEPVSEPTVGTDCTGWSYSVEGADRDKFYVYSPDTIFKKDRSGTVSDPYICWSHLDTTNQSYIDDADYTNNLPEGKEGYEYYGYKGRVYEVLDNISLTGIGTGKNNTTVMSNLRDGVYVQGAQITLRGRSDYAETIWNICDHFNKGTYVLRNALVLNETGNNDWYIPSKDELRALKDAVGAQTFAGMLKNPSDTSVNIYPWSSSASSNLARSWIWFWNQGQDKGMEYYRRFRGDGSYCLVLIRSF